MSRVRAFLRDVARARRHNLGLEAEDHERQIERTRAEVIRIYKRLLDKALAERDEARKTIERGRKVTEYWHSHAMRGDDGRDPVVVSVAHACACILMALDGSEEGWQEVARGLHLDQSEETP